MLLERISRTNFSSSSQSKCKNINFTPPILNCFSFQLDPSDPNYAQYADGVVDHQEGQPIFFYQWKANEMRDQEKNTMYVDFHHLANHPHNDGNFMREFVQSFIKCEKHMR